MTIRQETPRDYESVYTLIQQAFETAEHRDGDEQDYAAALREKEAFIPALSLVAEQDGKLIGQIMFTKTCVIDGDKQYAALLLSPLAVLWEHRSQGVGAALVWEGFARARSLGYTAVFLAGDPAYYGRFGFRHVSAFGIACSDNIPAQARDFILACELEPGALEHVTGAVDVQ